MAFLSDCPSLQYRYCVESIIVNFSTYWYMVVILFLLKTQSVLQNSKGNPVSGTLNIRGERFFDRNRPLSRKRDEIGLSVGLHFITGNKKKHDESNFFVLDRTGLTPLNGFSFLVNFFFFILDRAVD